MNFEYLHYKCICNNIGNLLKSSTSNHKINSFISIDYIVLCDILTFNSYLYLSIIYFSAHCISDQKVRTVVVRSVLKVNF